MPLITRVINPDLPESIGSMNTDDIRRAIRRILSGARTLNQVANHFGLNAAQKSDLEELVAAVQLGWLNLSEGLAAIPGEGLGRYLNETAGGYLSASEVALHFNFTGDEQQQYVDIAAVITSGVIPDGPYAGRQISGQDVVAALCGAEYNFPTYTHEFVCDRIGIIQWKYAARGGRLSGVGRGWHRRVRSHLPRVLRNGP